MKNENVTPSDPSTNVDTALRDSPSSNAEIVDNPPEEAILISGSEASIQQPELLEERVHFETTDKADSPVEEKILAYLNNNGPSFPHRIAAALGIETIEVVRAIRKLRFKWKIVLR